MCPTFSLLKIAPTCTPPPLLIQIVPNLSPVLNQNYAQLYPFLWNQNCAQINPFFADIVSNLFQFFFIKMAPNYAI